MRRNKIMMYEWWRLARHKESTLILLLINCRSGGVHHCVKPDWSSPWRHQVSKTLYPSTYTQLTQMHITSNYGSGYRVNVNININRSELWIDLICCRLKRDCVVLEPWPNGHSTDLYCAYLTMKTTLNRGLRIQEPVNGPSLLYVTKLSGGTQGSTYIYNMSPWRPTRDRCSETSTHNTDKLYIFEQNIEFKMPLSQFHYIPPHLDDDQNYWWKTSNSQHLSSNTLEITRQFGDEGY